MLLINVKGKQSDSDQIFTSSVTFYYQYLNQSKLNKEQILNFILAQSYIIV